MSWDGIRGVNIDTCGKKPWLQSSMWVKDLWFEEVNLSLCRIWEGVKNLENEIIGMDHRCQA